MSPYSLCKAFSRKVFKRFSAGALAVLAAVTVFAIGGAVPVKAAGNPSIDVWWPANAASLSGTQPFKAMLEGRSVDSYTMFWQVDGGTYNIMPSDYQNYPHKEASVDVSSWNWQSSGNYDVTFIAQDLQGHEIARTSVEVHVANVASAQVPRSSPQPQPQPQPVPQAAATGGAIDVSSPSGGATVNGKTAFTASLKNADPASYYMFWEVGSGTYNLMPTSGSGKSASVDLSGWNWESSGEYPITFIAQDLQGHEIARTTITVHIGNGDGVQSYGAVGQGSGGGSGNGANVFSGAKLYVDPSGAAVEAASSLASYDGYDASLVRTIADQSTASWFGGWDSNVQSDVSAVVSAAARSGSVPVLVAYNIPDRDCGGYSNGGAANASQYAQWIRSFAAGIGGNKTAVILEPDATSDTGCLSAGEEQARFAMLSDAVNVLKGAGASVYVDAGHADWVDPSTMAANLRASGIANADGFSLNVSNFYSTSDNEQYGDQVSALLGGKHFVIDTGRNGAGSQGAEWCNPQGAAIGALPTANTGSSLVDAFLWIKPPGESDGWCNGGPAAGTFWNAYAESLVRNSGR